MVFLSVAWVTRSERRLLRGCDLIHSLGAKGNFIFASRNKITASLPMIEF